MTPKLLSLCVTSALILTAGSAQAADPRSFSYVEFDYVVTGDTTFHVSGGGGSINLDLTRGYAIKAAFELGDLFFVTGETLQLDYDDSNNELGVVAASDAKALNDYTFIGAGAHMPAGDIVEVYGALGLIRPMFLHFSGDGFGVKLGGKVSAGMTEIDLWYQVGRAKMDIDGASVDNDPSILGLDVAINFAPDAPQLVLGYTTPSLQLIPAEPASTSIWNSIISLLVFAKHSDAANPKAPHYAGLFISRNRSSSLSTPPHQKHFARRSTFSAVLSQDFMPSTIYRLHLPNLS